jgi:DNA processing protein
MELQGRQLARNLVARDEWQPALSDGVVAIETSVTGGTTHAIEHARDARVPIAVFDYSSRPEMRFFEDGRFGGNVKYLREGASSIFLPETVDQFKSLMTGYRRRHDDVPVLGGTRQLAIEFE